MYKNKTDVPLPPQRHLLYNFVNSATHYKRGKKIAVKSPAASLFVFPVNALPLPFLALAQRPADGHMP
jgi:hypothetical protein